MLHYSKHHVVNCQNSHHYQESALLSTRVKRLEELRRVRPHVHGHGRGVQCEVGRGDAESGTVQILGFPRRLLELRSWQERDLAQGRIVTLHKWNIFIVTYIFL